MTEFERATLELMEFEKLTGIVEAISYSSELVFESVEFGFTIIFGYLIAAYYIGAKLTRIQVWIFNTFYLALMISNQIALRASYKSMLVWFDRLESDFSDAYRPFTATEEFYATIPFLGVAFVTGSLYFMWSIRNHNIE
jgi:hypothetical protein